MPDENTVPARLARIEEKLDKLLELAGKAEKFLHNPLGAYKAARLGKLPDGPTART